MIRLYALKGLSHGDLAEVTGILERGGIGVIPTDTLYGIVGLASSREAVERIYQLKGRDRAKPLSLLVESVEAASKLAWVTRHSRALADRFWPGPLTIVLPSRKGTKLPMQDGMSVGIRVPDSEICIRVIRAVGPLVAPSANTQGQAAPSSAAAIEPSVLAAVDFLIDAGGCPGGVESTVVDAREGVTILREGAVPSADIISVGRP